VCVQHRKVYRCSSLTESHRVPLAGLHVNAMSCFAPCFTAGHPACLLAQPVATCGDTDSTAEGAQPYACDASMGLVPKPDASMVGPPNDTVCCLVSTHVILDNALLSTAHGPALHCIHCQFSTVTEHIGGPLHCLAPSLSGVGSISTQQTCFRCDTSIATLITTANGRWTLAP
jgi:hypothetical protein